MSRIRPMTAREVETILRKYGFLLISQKGSHRKWRNELPVPVGTLRNIFQGAKIPESEWRI